MPARTTSIPFDRVYSDRTERVLQTLLASQSEAAATHAGDIEGLDGIEFDIDDYINRALPDPQSLATSLDQLSERIERQSKQVDTEIKLILYEESDHRSKTRTALNDATTAVQELVNKIRSISCKSESSQQLVADICTDIRVLDIGKRNITLTITSLKRLHMMVNGVAQLKQSISSRDFIKCADLLQALAVLDQYFKTISNVQTLADLQTQINQCRESLRSAVFEVFGAAGAGSYENHAILAEACKVAEVLGPECHSSLVQSVVRRQLDAYKSMYGPDEITGNAPVEDASFENTVKRFQWFRRQIRSFAERFGEVFPASWNIHAMISLEFCDMTSQHIRTLLNSLNRDQSLDVGVLVRVLSMTISFEREMTTLYSITSADVSALFKGRISAVFQPYLGGYITLEEDTLNELLVKLQTTESWSDATSNTRYPSSDQLFLFIKSSMKRCSRLDIKSIMISVQDVYISGLSQYASMLENQIPHPDPSSVPSSSSIPDGPNSQSLKGSSQAAGYNVPLVVIELNRAQLKSLGMIINTAEYCNETVPQLQESLSKLIETSTYDFSIVQDQFGAVVNKAIECVVSSIIFQTDKPLVAMCKLPLGTMIEVGDTSQYVQQIRSILHENLVSICEVIQSADNYHFLCNRLAIALLPRFLMAISKCKKLNDIGIQQLLLDAEALKTVLLDIPTIIATNAKTDADISIKKKIPKSFVSIVSKQIQKAEAILKTMSQPTEHIAETFHGLLPGGNVADLSRLIDLKGLRKSEQAAVLQKYNQLAPVQSQMPPIFKEDIGKKFYLF